MAGWTGMSCRLLGMRGGDAQPVLDQPPGRLGQWMGWLDVRRTCRVVISCASSCMMGASVLQDSGGELLLVPLDPCGTVGQRSTNTLR
jgi:hypothetical protein